MRLPSNVDQGTSGPRETRSVPLAWTLAAVALISFIAVGFSLDSDRSLSERKGVLTQVEAENDVIPSLPPD
jgi:hypothetical protein